MNIKTIDQLQDKLDKDLAWRKKELIQIKLNIKKTKDKSPNTDIRVGVAFLYAHWEGYIKYASSLYLNYVAQQKLNNDQLSKNFLAISLRKLIIECGKSNKTSVHMKLTDFIKNGFQEPAEIQYNKIINTQSNLYSERLKEIIITLGLDYSFYELKENLIDKKLVENRHEIAHGKYISVDVNDFEQLYESVLSMLDHFEEQIINAAESCDYKIN